MKDENKRIKPEPTIIEEFEVLIPLGARKVKDIMTIPCDDKGVPLGPLMRMYLDQRRIKKISKPKSKPKTKAKA